MTTASARGGGGGGVGRGRGNRGGFGGDRGGRGGQGGRGGRGGRGNFGGHNNSLSGDGTSNQGGGTEGGRGRGRGLTDEDKAAVSSARLKTLQISSEGTDDIIVANPEGVPIHIASFILKKTKMEEWTQRQIRLFVNSCLLNLSNHHGADTSGVLRDLASDTGLDRLKDIILRPMSVDAGDERSVMSFQYVILPLIGVLTRQKVCQTTMTSESGIIYSTVYFHRRQFLQDGVLRCMERLLDRGSLDDYSMSAHFALQGPAVCRVSSLQRALIAIVRLVYQLVKRKRDAQIEMADMVQNLHGLVLRCTTLPAKNSQDTFENTNLTLEMGRLQQVVNDAQDTVIRPVEPTRMAVHVALSGGNHVNLVQLQHHYDPPGELSKEGPRHDNDCLDISEISVLPTQKEIVSKRRPFLPSNDISEAPHFLPAGWRRQIDIHFRLYREDMMDSLRKGVGSFISLLERTDKNSDITLLKQKELRKELNDSVSLNVYGNVQFEGMNNTKQLAGSILMSFSQPPQIADEPTKRRKEFWERSRRRLMQGAMVCIASRTPSNSAGLHTDPRSGTQNFRMILGVITQRDIDVLAKGPKVAQIHISLSDPLSYLLMLDSTRQNSAAEQWFLVESTGSFFESYRPILKALQICVPATMPFGKYLAPTSEEMLQFAAQKGTIDPPLYTRAPGFRFDLSILLKDNRPCQLEVDNSQSVEKAIDMLRAHSTLDNTQASALVETLSREIALIKGPPGTGKTKIGVDLMRVLLHNKIAMNCGPILCICYTNHALDQFLEHLLDQGVTSIVRVGSRSKSNRLEDYNLTSLMQSRERPYDVYRSLRDAHEQWDGVSKKIGELEKALKDENLDWEYVSPYLMMYNTAQWQQLMHDPEEVELEEEDDEGYTRVRRNRDQSPYMRWATSTDLKEKDEWNRRQEQEEARQKIKKRNKNIFDILRDGKTGVETSLPRVFVPKTNRPLSLLRTGNVWSMSSTERRRLIETWKPEVLEMMMGQMKQLLRQVDEISVKKNNAYDEIRRGILTKATVIGMTTNGAAKHQTLISAVAPKIIICEEAGEVLEAHILTALSASTQHLILIGDHLQLRPQIETYNLSSDSLIGKQHNLDRSLFERLVTSSTNPLPMSHLTIQRRMRPEISSLIRNTLYPELEDGEKVLTYPDVAGMGANLYFMDHAHPEDAKDQYGMQSFANTFEVKMVEALAHYLIKNGYDQPGDIAVLTPYLGQLSKLRDHLRKSFMLVIDDRDMEQLEENEAEEGIDSEVTQAAPPLVGVKNVSLQNHLTLRTIDNYQGEEAKVIIISLVRSDVRTKDVSSSGSIGFLKSPNRTNVLLSRAQHGMYLIGKASLMNQSKHGIWPKVMDELDAYDRIGDGFPIVCKNHPDTFRYVDTPEKLKIAAPNGGCTIACGRSMPCGHVCPLSCHPDDEAHALVKCFEPCPRLQPGCRHACPKHCGDKCGLCMEVVSPMALPCGHILEEPRCWQKRDASKVTCTVKVLRKLPHCEHKQVMECSKDPSQAKCNVKCGKDLECGHACLRSCHECQELSSPESKKIGAPFPTREIERAVHGKCKVECGRSQFCGHGCKFWCHGKEPCPPCKQNCAVMCTHFKCHHSCDFPCAACSERCIWECPHQGQCNMPCGAPCDRLPCNMRCDKNLPCGHQCPSLCGEVCPGAQYCVECKDPDTMNMLVDLVMQQALGEVDVNEDPLLVPSCGHALTMTSFDGMMEMNQYYEERVDRVTGASTFVNKVSLPSEQVSQVCCPMCRKPILELLRYGRRVKYSQLSMRNKKHIQAQAADIQQAQDDTEVASIRVVQAHDEFMKAMDKFKTEPKEEPPARGVKTLGRPSNTAEFFPGSNYMRIADYGLPMEQEKAWEKLVQPLSKAFRTYRKIFQKASNSPNKKLFEAAVSHLYRIKAQENALLDAEGGGVDGPTTDEIIQVCILECGLQADGNGGSSFVESLQEQTNILLLVLAQALAALDKAGPSSGWFWFVEDLIQCALEHAHLTKQAAIKGIFSRHVTYAGLTRMTLLCHRVQLIGRKSLPRDPVSQAARLRTVRELEVLFAEQMTEISNSPLGIRAESERNAKVLKERMDKACMVARGEGTISKEEKMEIFRAVSEHMRGSGHWYQCPNGHPYAIGECGMAMEQARCPECGASIGGGEHALLQSNRRDLEMEGLYRARR